MAEDAIMRSGRTGGEQMKVWEENRLKRRSCGAGRGAASFRFGSPAVGGYSALVEKWHQACMDHPYEIWSELHPEPEAPELWENADLESKRRTLLIKMRTYMHRSIWIKGDALICGSAQIEAVGLKEEGLPDHRCRGKS